jgi:hypothetical protein
MTSQTHTKITFIWSYIKWIENCAKKQAKLQLLILILNHTFITLILLLPLFTITMPNVTAGGIFFPRGHCNLVALLKQL